MQESVQSAAQKITAANLLAHVEKLASDEFEGRKPGTVGETRTVEYLMHECKKRGLGLGDWMGGYLQKMPVTGVISQCALAFKSGATGTLQLAMPTDFVARAAHDRAKTNIADRDVVFVGYGIEAPQYGWDDYKGFDVKDKLVIMLVGDPRRPQKEDPTLFDESFFNGKGMTYFGRWTYKYEIAFAKGAAGVLIVHDTERAGYGYDVVTSSWGVENLFLSGDKEHCDLEGWISQPAAERLFNHAGLNLDKCRLLAQETEFKPIALNLTASAEITNTVRKFETSNVVAKIDGSDPKLKDECVIYCAHWDHFGKVVDASGETVGIYSGATDNGSGVATVLEIATAFQALPEPPKRTIYFLFTTLEESGLLGANFYIENPAMPLEKTVAIVNFDSMNMWGRTSKFVSIASGHSTVDTIVERHAKAQGREIIGDRDPEKGFIFRSDHLPFMRKGVPAAFCLNPGYDYIGKTPEWGMQKRADYIKNDYHKFTDKVKPDWDLSGLVEDAQLMFYTGLEIANASDRPQWLPSSEFRDGGRALAGKR